MSVFFGVPLSEKIRKELHGMIQTIVVDDEWYSLIEICDLAEKTGIMSVEGRFQNGADALREAERIHPQAAFIDIEMPEMDGLTLAEKLLETDPDIKIVFITGWSEYAVSAFELNALDYIMKPVNKVRFDKMVKHLQYELSAQKPDGTAALTIRCFEKFEALGNGMPIVWRRAKAEELFTLLVLNANTFVPKDIILENLWPHCERKKAIPILQTSVYTIRNVLSDCRESVRLTYANGKYGLSLSSDVICDYQTVRNAVEQFHAGDKKTYGSLKAACVTFQKGLLPYSNYKWSGNYEAELRRSLAECLQLMADSSPEEKTAAIGLLPQIIHGKETGAQC